jgi:hypothetical protein
LLYAGVGRLCSAQMVDRFQQNIVDRHPERVVILAGIKVWRLLIVHRIKSITVESIRPTWPGAGTAAALLVAGARSSQRQNTITATSETISATGSMARASSAVADIVDALVVALSW